jgi:anti-sigma factor RsiW
MNCDRTEQMLSAFLEGDLSSADESAVNAHVASCESCRESLDAYRALEDELVSRRDLVPPADTFLRAVFAPAVSPNLHRARVLMDRIFSFPALTAFFCFVIGWLAFAYSDAVQGWMGQVAGSTPAASRFAGWLSALGAASSGGDMLMVSIAYGLMTVLVLASGAWMTLRYVHND